MAGRGGGLGGYESGSVSFLLRSVFFSFKPSILYSTMMFSYEFAIIFFNHDILLFSTVYLQLLQSMNYEIILSSFSRSYSNVFPRLDLER